LRRGHTLGRATPGWRSPSAAWVRRCRRFIELDPLLPKLLDGDNEPASALERLDLASLCRLPCKRLHAAAARLAADAFAIDPKLAGNMREQYRYLAGCSAVLAAAGQSEDARVLPDKVVLKLRKQAHRWLQADLTLYARMTERAEARVTQAVRQVLLSWRADADLVSVRGAAALDRLDADERQQWQRLWQDVDALLRKVASTK
jgi:hypothetical protein